MQIALFVHVCARLMRLALLPLLLLLALAEIAPSFAVSMLVEEPIVLR